MNIKKLIKEKFGDEMSGYVYTGHQDLEDFGIEIWNKAIEAADKNAEVMPVNVPSAISGSDYTARFIVNKQSILKLKK